MPQRNLLTTICLAIVCLACYSKAPTNRFARDFERAIRIVERYYVKPQDKQQLFEASLQGMMRSLDEHSAFLPGDQLQSMNEKLNQGYGGVGIRIDFDNETHRLQVISPILDSPAFQAGILAGDVIVKIDGIAFTVLASSTAPSNKIDGVAAVGSSLYVLENKHRCWDEIETDNCNYQSRIYKIASVSSLPTGPADSDQAEEGQSRGDGIPQQDERQDCREDE